MLAGLRAIPLHGRRRIWRDSRRPGRVLDLLAPGPLARGDCHRAGRWGAGAEERSEGLTGHGSDEIDGAREEVESLNCQT